MPGVPVADPFQYVLLRVVPDLDRGETLNAGVVVFCRGRGFLAARTRLDRAKLSVLAPRAGADADGIERTLLGLERIAAGDTTTGGPLAALPASERFHWLAAPASTAVQPGPVHTGLCRDPEATLDRLFASLVV